MSSPRNAAQKPALDEFEKELDVSHRKTGKVQSWLDARPEVFAHVKARLEAAQKDKTAASPTQIWRALTRHFKAPFSDYTFRRWVRDHYGDDIFRTQGAS